MRHITFGIHENLQQKGLDGLPFVHRIQAVSSGWLVNPVEDPFCAHRTGWWNTATSQPQTPLLVSSRPGHLSPALSRPCSSSLASKTLEFLVSVFKPGIFFSSFLLFNLFHFCPSWQVFNYQWWSSKMLSDQNCSWKQLKRSHGRIFGMVGWWRL